MYDTRICLYQQEYALHAEGCLPWLLLLLISYSLQLRGTLCKSNLLAIVALASKLNDSVTAAVCDAPPHLPLVPSGLRLTQASVQAALAQPGCPAPASQAQSQPVTLRLTACLPFLKGGQAWQLTGRFVQATVAQAGNAALASQAQPQPVTPWQPLAGTPPGNVSLQASIPTPATNAAYKESWFSSPGRWCQPSNQDPVTGPGQHCSLHAMARTHTGQGGVMGGHSPWLAMA